ncbi:MAG TPA: uroporphyrinogen-III C-methyltransferase [Candidatus Babeliales bacterium]|nr:uroporphyrinogen-III C-methyltransferase [Candidatus Babeliales bacterium]
MTGRVYLVGAGPGDPGLLTLRAAQVLRVADVLLYDALASDAVVALAPEECEKVFVGKRGGDHAAAQREIEALMIAKARAGCRVVRLKGGDPFIFGRGGEEAEALQAAGVPFEVVPGVSSALAAPAYAGIPITHRDHAASFTVLTGHEDPGKPASTLDWVKLADSHRTLVILMAVANLREIARQLVGNGLDPQTPVAIIQDGTRPSQRCVRATLATIADEAERAKIESPAVVVVGGVARLRERLRWFDAGGLFAKRIAITRAGEQSQAFARALLERGAEPIFAPAIAIEPPDDPLLAERALDQLHSYAWLIFTSQNGVDAFFERLATRGLDARAIGSAKVAAIGDRTAARLRDRGVRADAVPEAFVGEEVARVVIERSRPGDRVLVFRAQEARDVLPRMLEEAGRVVSVAPAYRTVVPSDSNFAGKIARADAITFTSASTVRGFVALLGGASEAERAADGKCIACIGPITARAAADVGLRVDIVAGTYTTAGLLEALEAYFASPA